MPEDYKQMLDWLYGLRRFGMKLDLDRIKNVMDKLGNSQDKLKIIHVAGTNGKGSVCAMIGVILQKAGYRVGMFTSPHLVDFRERFQINGEMINQEDVLRLVDMVKETDVELTFFEFATAIAFQYFYEQNVDYAIIEVGLGGRFDATNIVNPIATVITSISLDHIEHLGNTIDKITYEKAGIVKENVPLFTTCDIDVIKSICEKKNAQIFIIKDKENTSMKGEFQKINAGLAAVVARYLKISEDKIKEGLLDVKWPARLEFVDKNVLLDCAHNPDGIEKMAEFVKTLKYDKLVIVFGVMYNKDYENMIKNLPEYNKIILTKPKIPRSLDPFMVKHLCRDALIIENAVEAYEYAKKIAGENDLILICGSCYLAGEFMAFKNKISVHPIMFVQ